MGQRTAHGYVFILNVMFRPPLMVLGFMVASAGVIVIGTFVVQTFGTAMAVLQADGSATGSWTGLGSMIGFVIIFFTIMSAVIHGCFNAIHIIPDQVLGWVGGSVSSGQFGQKVSDNTTAASAVGAKELAGGIGESRKALRGQKPNASPPPPPAARGAPHPMSDYLNGYLLVALC